MFHIAPGIRIVHVYRCVTVCMKDMGWNRSIMLKNDYFGKNWENV